VKSNAQSNNCATSTGKLFAEKSAPHFHKPLHVRQGRPWRVPCCRPCSGLSGTTDRPYLNGMPAIPLTALYLERPSSWHLIARESVSSQILAAKFLRRPMRMPPRYLCRQAQVRLQNHLEEHRRNPLTKPEIIQIEGYVQEPPRGRSS
jgi:hypothetical protein